MGNGVNVCGFFGRPNGLGQSARNCVRALDAAGVPRSLVNWPLQGKSYGYWADSGEPRYPLNIFHCNPDAAPGFNRYLGPGYFRGKRSVAYWFWETDTLPADRVKWVDFYDEIWCPSRYVYTVLKEHTDKLRLITMAIDVEAKADRARFGIPEEAFAVVTMFEGLSTLKRKNPLASLAAFEQADIPNSVLVVKSHNLVSKKDRAFIADALQRSKARERIIWLDGTLDHEAVLSLIASCDALLSLHRCEGFGLPLAEAMALGTVAIGTGYGANVDFMTASNSCPVKFAKVPVSVDRGPYTVGYWAEPDISDAARLLDAVAHDSIYRRSLIQRACYDMLQNHSPIVVGKQWEGAINAFYETV